MCAAHAGDGRHRRDLRPAALAQAGAARLKRGVFHSPASLQEAINRFVAEANTKPKPFHWAKDPDTIIAAVRREHQVLDYSG